MGALPAGLYLNHIHYILGYKSNTFEKYSDDGASCVSMTIFQTSPDGTPSATNINCRRDWQAYTLYRELEFFVTITGEYFIYLVSGKESYLEMDRYIYNDQRHLYHVYSLKDHNFSNDGYLYPDA
jgi:hypothetical protein